MQLHETQDLSPRTDAELVGLVARGEREAYASLMARHNQRLFRVAWALTKNRSEAEDVVQDAWVIAFQSLHQLGDAARFGAWLARIAVNEALRRRRFDLRHEELTDEGEIPHMGDDNPETLAARRELRPILEVAVSALPVALRSVFVLREVEGLSVLEVSEVLGIPEATVKTRAFRAREMLRRRIVDWSDSATPGILQFAGARCAELTAKVLSRLDLKLHEH